MMHMKTLAAFALKAALFIGAAQAEETTLRIAAVNNPQMVLMMESFTDDFEAAHEGIRLEWTLLDENEFRRSTSTSLTTGRNEFDVITAGSFYTPIWAAAGLIQPLTDMPSDFQTDNIFPILVDSLSHDGELYSVPYYAESAFTMYRTDIFEEAGLNMPVQPDWNFLREAAAKITDMQDDVYGICLRGAPGWGKNIALLTAMANAYGARWFDADGRPELDSDAWRRTLQDYVAMLTESGPPNSHQLKYLDVLDLFLDGKCAIWVDSTAAGSLVTDPQNSAITDKVGFALAPGHSSGRTSAWLWAWGLAIPTSSPNTEAAKKFVAFATSVAYRRQIIAEFGWPFVPVGGRLSLYTNPNYIAASPFAELAATSLQEAALSYGSTVQIPYIGIQYVQIPSFPVFGDAAGERFATALAGEISPEQALADSQRVTERVIARARLFNVSQ